MGLDPTTSKPHIRLAAAVLAIVIGALIATGVDVGHSGAAVPDAPPPVARADSTAPAGCKLFNPMFAWRWHQTKTMRASANRCDTPHGRSSWLIFKRNGDLVYYLRGRELWDSGTSGRKNRLIERGYGAMEIVGPAGDSRWGNQAPSSQQFTPNPPGGFGVGFSTAGTKPNAPLTRWEEDEVPCGKSGCSVSLWISGQGVQ
jgi:hypothetical protein